MLVPLTVVDVLSDRPALLAVAAVVLRALFAAQARLSWPEYRTAHGLKRWVFPILQRRAPVLSWVNEKGDRSDAEFVATVDAHPRAVASHLDATGGHLHLLNSVKRRPVEHGDPLSLAHVVFVHDDGTQTEAFGFANDDGSSDWYAHHEPDPSRVLAHLGGDQQSDGDPRGVVGAALAEFDPSD